MSVRDLKVVETHHGSAKEFNHLRVSNLQDFLNSYENNIEFYKSPFEILADLESQVKFANNPEKVVLCAYKDEGDIIFDLVGIKDDGKRRIAEYEYSTSIS